MFFEVISINNRENLVIKKAEACLQILTRISLRNGNPNVGSMDAFKCLNSSLKDHQFSQKCLTTFVQQCNILLLRNFTLNNVIDFLCNCCTYTNPTKIGWINGKQHLFFAQQIFKATALTIDPASRLTIRILQSTILALYSLGSALYNWLKRCHLFAPSIFKPFQMW